MLQACCHGACRHCRPQHHKEGRTVKIRVEDRPEERDRKTTLIKATKILALKLPSTYENSIDWPDRIYAKSQGPDGAAQLLAKQPHGAKQVSWCVPTIR